MTPLGAYFLGLLTVVVILFVWWLVARLNPTVGQSYRQVVCAGLNV